MKVLLFGASGMIGQGVLRECLADDAVTEVLAVVRAPLAQRHPKLREVVHADLAALDPIADALRGYDACIDCLGVSAAGLDEARYRALTYDLTLAIARQVLALNPEITFEYVSGAGTDSTAAGRTMWARVKGETENALLALPFRRAFMLRPGLILPRHGIVSRTPFYRVVYAVLGPLFSVVMAAAPRLVTTTERLGRVMLRVAREGAPKRVLEMSDLHALEAT